MGAAKRPYCNKRQHCAWPSPCRSYLGWIHSTVKIVIIENLAGTLELHLLARPIISLFICLNRGLKETLLRVLFSPPCLNEEDYGFPSIIPRFHRTTGTVDLKSWDITYVPTPASSHEPHLKATAGISRGSAWGNSASQDTAILPPGNSNNVLQAPHSPPACTPLVAHTQHVQVPVAIGWHREISSSSKFSTVWAHSKKGKKTSTP